MPTGSPPSQRRRLPVQGRSRARVAQILDAAARLVVEDGVEALTTRGIADEAGVPVASLYQYFSDKDAVLLALVERDMAEMDAQVADDLAALETISVRSVVETTMRAYVKVYHRRPAFLEIWMRGRGNATIRAYGREHNRRTAQDLLAFVADLGVTGSELTVQVAELAVEVGDRVFQLAFETRRRGDTYLIEQGIDLVTSYLERFATQAGRDGVPA